MAKARRVIAVAVLFLFLTAVYAIAKEGLPHAAWLRILISVGGFGLLMYVWHKLGKVRADKEP